MLAPPSGLLRTGLALKLDQMKLAAGSYVLMDKALEALINALSYCKLRICNAALSHKAGT